MGTQGTIESLVVEQARRDPDALAVVLEAEALTYGELDRASSRLALELRREGVGVETPVGLAVERSLEMVVALVAILKAGGAYVPLDPAYPGERLDFMRRDSGIEVVLASPELVRRRPEVIGAESRRVSLDGAAEVPTAPVDLEPAPAWPERLAYIVYTSGSTGVPKGVAVSHRAVVRLVHGADFLQLDPDDAVLQFAPLAFDASTLEIWGPLTNGARMVVTPPGPRSVAELATVIEEQGVTVAWLSAGLFHHAVDQELPGLTGLRALLAGGDVLSPPHVRRAVENLPATRVINGYGPTENTTFTTCHGMETLEEVGEGAVPIGRPIHGTRVALFGPRLLPVDSDAVGTLFAGGDGVARGYWGRPVQTAERFVPDPSGARPGERLYDTGDLARQRDDGVIEFLGRADRQVKIAGFRIEPGEIEATLAQHPAIETAVVDPRPGPGGSKRLVAWVRSSGTAPSRDELRKFLARRLPPYLIPTVFVSVENLPLTPNGKVDRRALADP